jgi:hypothetical protein
VHRSGQILEQRKPGAECGRLDHEPVLVDQPESRQRLVEGGAAVGDQVVPRFAPLAPSRKKSGSNNLRCSFLPIRRWLPRSSEARAPDSLNSGAPYGRALLRDRVRLGAPVS